MECETGRAENLCNIGNRQEALKIYGRLIAKGEKTKQIRLYDLRAECYRKNKDYTSSIHDLDVAIKLHKADDSQKKTLLQARGLSYYAIKQLSRSLSDYEAACEICKQLEGCAQYSCQNAFSLKRKIRRGVDWEKIVEDGSGVIYYDKTRVLVKSERDVKAWLRFEPTFEVQDGLFQKEDFSHRLDLVHIDCVNQEIGYSSVISYDTDGKLTGS